MPGKATIRGYIEKKKDWLERARDYQEKDKQVRHLKQKAKDKNPDEFHHHMIRSQVRLDGVHQDLDDSSDEDNDVQKILSDIRDLQYVKHKLSVEDKKIEKLQGTLHFTGTGGSSRNFATRRTIFVDNEGEALKKKRELTVKVKPETSTKVPALKEEEKKNIEETTRHQYAELQKRMERAKELRIVLQKLELKKNLELSKKGELRPKLVKKGGTTRPASYKWTFERKK